MTRFQLHVREWDDCQRCSLADGRNKVCHRRGPIPADVVLCGEAPGQSEDILGKPFVGPAGKLLDAIVDSALDQWRGSIRVMFANLVGCFPSDAKKTADHAPPIEAVRRCRPRLEELLAIAQPRLVVAVGKLAQQSIERGYKESVRFPKDAHVAGIMHPAALLRMTVVQRDMEIKRAVVILREAWERVEAGTIIEEIPF